MRKDENEGGGGGTANEKNDEYGEQRSICNNVNETN